MSKALSTPAQTESAGTRLRRAMARVCAVAADAADPVGAAVLVVVVLAGAVHIGPDWLQVREWDLVLLALVVYGGSRVLEVIATWIAELLTPDGRDGDLLQDAELLVQQIRLDLENGADIDQVLSNLRESHLTTTLADLVHELALQHQEQETKRGGVGDPSLNAAAWNLYAAEKSVGQA